MPSDGTAVYGEATGGSVAISGNTVVIGGPFATINNNSQQGAVYVFTRSGTTWTEQKLIASDGATGDFFGRSVGIKGDTIMVGAPFDDVGANANQGSAYVFGKSAGSWTEQTKLVADDGAANAGFGIQVRVDGNKIAVVAAGDVFAQYAGEGIYIFNGSSTNWSLQAKVVENDGSTRCTTSKAFAFSGDTFVCGYSTGFGTGNLGVAFVFTVSGATWTKQTLSGDSDFDSNNFGGSVALSGNTLIIGAYGGKGSAFVYEKSNNSWARRQRIDSPSTPSSPTETFGFSVALDGNSLIVGNGREVFINNTVWTEAAYVYVVNSKSTQYDFDGDGKADVGIFRVSDGSWWYNRSSSTDFRVYSFGTGTDIMTPGDYTGDGKADIAIFRPASGEWFIQRSEDNSFFSFPFGQVGDIPAPADYDNDGKADAAVFRPSTGTWYILNSGGSGTGTVDFGGAEDKPVPADYDGDGKADIAIFRPSDGSWWYLRSSDLQFRVYRFGVGTDRPVPGDWTGDGKADIAVWRPSTGEWFFQRSEDNSYYSLPFGANGDIVAPSDYDGDGKFDTAVFRPSTGEWYVQRSTAGTMITSFGGAGDRPIPNAFVP